MTDRDLFLFAAIGTPIVVGVGILISLGVELMQFIF
jgi:hypothetical protein